MEAGQDQQSPELGESTPLRTPKGRWYQRPATVALAFGVGVAVGGGGGVLIANTVTEGDGMGEQAAPTTTTVRPDQTTVVEPQFVVPRECEVALTEAERGMALLSDGLRSLGDLDVNRLNETLRTLEQLRPDFAANVRDCRAKVSD